MTMEVEPVVEQSESSSELKKGTDVGTVEDQNQSTTTNEDSQTGSPGAETAAPVTENEGISPPAQKKRTRARDNLAIAMSPELSTTGAGKRQRKVNPNYSGFALDKKTAHVLGQDAESGESANSDIAETNTSPQQSPSAAASSSTSATTTAAPNVPITKTTSKELLMSPVEAQQRKKKLPKGYVYEVVPVAPVVPVNPLPNKRERRKSASYNSDFVQDPSEPSPPPPKEKSKRGKQSISPNKRGKAAATTTATTPVAPVAAAAVVSQQPPPLIDQQQQQQQSESQSQPSSSTTTTTTTNSNTDMDITPNNNNNTVKTESTTTNNDKSTNIQENNNNNTSATSTTTTETTSSSSAAPVVAMTQEMLQQKAELERQLAALQNQIKSAAQELENKQKQLSVAEESATSPVLLDPTATPINYANPAYVGLPKKGGRPPSTGKKQQKKSKTVYDRFDSDEEELVSGIKTRKRQRGGRDSTSSSTTVTAGRGRRTTRQKYDDYGVAEEADLADEVVSAADLPGIMGRVQRVLRKLREEKWAWPFLQPVDPVALGIHDYFDIIKNPMDLGTIWTSLNAGEYDNPDEVAEDVRLVFTNATTYNQAGSDIAIMSEHLSKKFEQWIRPVLHSYHNGGVTHARSPTTSSIPLPNIQDKESMGEVVGELMKSMEAFREEIARLKEKERVPYAASPVVAPVTPVGGAAPGRRGPRSKAAAAEETREMTFEEKRALSLNINNLQPEHLGKVVQIIQTRMPHLAESGEEIEIDIDALDTGTLRALEKFVKQCLAKKPPAAAPAAPVSAGPKNPTGRRKGRPPRQSAEVAAANLPGYQEKLAQADASVEQADKNIQNVKKRLQELNAKSQNLGRKNESNEIVDIDDETPNRTYPSVHIPKDDSSSDSSSSDSSSDSSSSSTDSDSSSDSDVESSSKPKPGMEGNAPVVAIAPTTTTTTTAPTTTTTGQETAAQSSSTSATAVANEKPADQEEPTPAIIPPVLKKEIEFKNLDSWTNLSTLITPAAPQEDVVPNTADDTWSQFQNRDQQKKQREKEKQEQEERERKERAEKEAERKRQEEIRLQELREEEERRKKAEEESRLAAQRELAEKRAAERRAREEATPSVNMLEQNVLMSSFERGDFQLDEMPSGGSMMSVMKQNGEQ